VRKFYQQLDREEGHYFKTKKPTLMTLAFLFH